MMNRINTIIGIVAVAIAVFMASNISFASGSAPKTLVGMYVNENTSAVRIEFKENGTFLFHNQEEVFAHGTYEVEEGTNTLLCKLGNGSAVRFNFTRSDLTAFSHPKMGIWVKR